MSEDFDSLFHPEVRGWARWVVVTAKRFSRRYPECEVRDLVITGATELWLCTTRWTEEGSATFRTYAFPRVRWAMWKEVCLTMGWKYLGVRFRTKLLSSPGTEDPKYRRATPTFEPRSDASIDWCRLRLKGMLRGISAPEMELFEAIYASPGCAGEICREWGITTAQWYVIRLRVREALKRSARGARIASRRATDGLMPNPSPDPREDRHDRAPR